MLDTKNSVVAATERQKNINNINLNTLFNFTKSLDSDVEKISSNKSFLSAQLFRFRT